MWTLEALRRVGNSSVVIRLDARLFPLDTTRACVARHGNALSLSSAGELTVTAGGTAAWESLRRFTNDLLAAALERE